jgi:polar amino acid transport system substrate-binding protein
MRTLIIIFIFTINTFGYSREVLKWAADAEGNAPYIFQDPNSPDNLIGFEIDIARAIAEQLQLKERFIQNQWDGLIPGLYRGDYDIAINGLEITEERRKAVLFSKPYYVTHLSIVIRFDSDSLSDLYDLQAMIVGALKNSQAETVLSQFENIKVRTYEGEVNAFEDLKNGRIDAVLVDYPIALYYASWNPEMKIVGEPISEVRYGIALKKDDEALLKLVNNALDSLFASGRLKDILAEWNLWNEQMEEYTGDYFGTSTAPVRYDDFVKAMTTEISLEETIVRYISFMPMIARAALMTVNISVLSMLIAIILGLFIAVSKVYAPKPISIIASVFIEIIRGTPLLIQLFFIFYALPAIGLKLSPFLAAIIGLGVNYAAYEAENYRAGLFSVPKGQIEAALSLGMSKRKALRYVVLPQAFRLVLPPVTNDFISLLKDSSLVSVITLVELTKLYNQLSSTYFDYIGTGILIATVYLLLGLPFVKLSRNIERRLNYPVDKKII